MVKYYRKFNEKIVEIPPTDKNCWINISPPFHPESLKKISAEHNIPLDFLVDSLDIDERSRYQVEGNVKLIVIKTPIVNERETENDAYFLTTPIGIVLNNDVIITISPQINPIIHDFIDGRVKNFDPHNRSNFILHIFDRSTFHFLQYLKEINARRNLFEDELYTSSKNEELFRLLRIEKSLVYFVTALRSNENVMLKLHRTNILEYSEEDKDLLQDIIVDNSQALEMANTYTNILSSTMDAFASIISNNLNVVVKRLTSVTIILMIPTIVASFYGMNVKIPFQQSPLAFAYTVIITLAIIAFTIWFFLKKKWF